MSCALTTRFTSTATVIDTTVTIIAVITAINTAINTINAINAINTTATSTVSWGSTSTSSTRRRTNPLKAGLLLLYTYSPYVRKRMIGQE